MKKLFETIENFGGVGCSLWYEDGRKVNFTGLKTPYQNEWLIDIVEETATKDGDINRVIVLKTNENGAIEYIKNNF